MKDRNYGISDSYNKNMTITGTFVAENVMKSIEVKNEVTIVYGP